MKKLLLLSLAAAALVGTADLSAQRDQRLRLPQRVESTDDASDDAADEAVQEPTGKDLPGELKRFVGKGFYFDYDGDYNTTLYPINGLVADFKFDYEGKKVYYIDPLPYRYDDMFGYIVGDLSDDGKTITFTFPQPYCYGENYYGPYVMLAHRMNTHKDMNTVSVTFPEAADDKWVMTLSDDGKTITTDLPAAVGTAPWPEQSFMLAFADTEESSTDEQDWTVAGLADITYTLMEEEITTMPADATVQQWIYGNGDFGREVNVAIDGDNIYIANWDDCLSADAAVKGVIGENTVTFPGNSFLGEAYVFSRYAWLMGGKADKRVVYGHEIIDMNDGYDAEMVFNYDPEKKRIWKEDYALLVNCDLDSRKDRSFVYNPEIKFQGEVVYTTPRAPKLTIVQECTADFPQGYVEVIISPYDLDGNYLNPDNLYYCVYFDGLLWTFQNDEYAKFAELGIEELKEVPYNFHDGYDFYSDGVYKYFYYFSPEDNIQATTVFYTPDGTRLESEKSAPTSSSEDPGESSVSELGANQVLEAEWYSLDGVRLSAPAKGISIKTVKMADGSRKTLKSVRF